MILRLFFWIIAIVLQPFILVKERIGFYTKSEKSQIEKLNTGAEYLDNKKWIYYRRLIKKYPEMKWVKKYIITGNFISIKGLISQLVKEQYNLHTIWTYNAKISDLLSILDYKIPVSTDIYLKNGCPHSIIIKKYSKTAKAFITADSLGHYNSNYSLKYNELCYLSKSQLIENNTGDDIMISVTLPKNHPLLRKIRPIITKYKYYEF